jgi:phenylacetate-CoA ligase
MEKVTYWNKEMETLPREKLEALQLQRFRERMQYVYERSPMYRRKYDEAGIKPSDIQSLDDIQNVPFTVKEELRESQSKQPPWGDFPCIPPEEGVRVFQTTGTTGIPVKVLLNKTDWYKHFYEQFMHFMCGYGIRTSDILFVPFGYSLYIAWWGFQAALEQEGVMIVPGGAQSSKDRVRNVFDWGATVVCGTPTYLLYLGEAAKEMGVALADSSVRVVVAAGEPGANVPSTKRAIEELWGGKCYDDIGSTEISNFGFECIAQKGTHVIDTMFYPECLDPDTLKPVPDGEVGELVLSNLCTESVPLLRYRMKDLVFPSAIENLIRGVPEFSNEYQIVVPKMGSGKRLKIRIEPDTAHIAQERLEEAVDKFIETFKYRITITPDVEVVEAGKLPRFELKARRLIREE